jgi:hypothetical protein
MAPLHETLSASYWRWRVVLTGTARTVASMTRPCKLAWILSPTLNWGSEFVVCIHLLQATHRRRQKWGILLY